MTRRHALYRFYSTTGELLYVGITLDPGARWKAHSKDKPWWADVARVTIEEHPDRVSVLEAERTAIIAEKPLHNVVHNTSPRDPLAALYEPNLPSSMPDDCHDHCGKNGILSIYFPYRWAQGVAHYRCNRGHSWTCGWGLVKGSGEDLTNFGTPLQQFLIDEEFRVIPPRVTREQAREQVKKDHAQRRSHLDDYMGAFYNTWPECRWATLPRSIDSRLEEFFDAGLPEHDLIDAAWTALTASNIENRGAYFIGVCRNRVQEMSNQLVTDRG